MKTDLEAAVWTRMGMRPVKMGRIYITGSECRFTYDSDFLHTGLPGIGLIYPPDIVQQTTIVRSRTEYFDLLPPLQLLIPPRGENNFQRQLVLKYLAKRGIVPAKGFDTDWEILKVAGHGGIGHLDVFQDDAKAIEWYSTPVNHNLVEVTDDFGFSLKEFLTWFDADAEALINMIGPTPTVGGAIPKILVSITEGGWDNRIGLPGRAGAHGTTDAILKFEQSGSYPGIIELEALSLDIHEEAGFDVPRRWTTLIRDIPTLIIERFDRDRHCAPLFTETLYSIFASADKSITNNHSITYDYVARAIDRSPIDLFSDRKAAKRHLLQRLLLALAIGNGDLHLENLSIIEKNGALSFSPVYDPTPMRAYSIHNLLVPMTFGGYGEKSASLQEAIQNFSRNLGFRKKQLLEDIEKTLSVTKDYSERISSLQTLPGRNKKNLISITSSIREELQNMR